MKRHLPAIVLAVGTLLVGAFLAFYLHREVERQVLSQFNEIQLLMARDTAGHIESYFDARARDVRYLSSLLSLQHLDAKTMPAELEIAFTLLKTAYVKNIVVLNATGQVAHATAGGGIGSDSTESDIRAWARTPVNKGTVRLVWEKVDTPAAPGTWVGVKPPSLRFFLVTPLYLESGAGDVPGAGGRFAGTLRLTVELDLLVAEALGPTSARNPHPLRLWAMDEGGTLLLQSEHPEMLLRNIRTTSTECRQCHTSFDYVKEMLTAKQGTSEYQLAGQPSKVAAFAPMTVAGVSWIVVVNAPKDEVTSFIRANSLEALGLFGVVGIVVGLTLLSAYRNSRQEIVIAEEAKHLEEKEHLVEKLRETGDYLENLFVSANAPMLVWNPKLRIVRFNRACERLTGYAASEVIGQELRTLFPEERREESLAKIVHAPGDEGREPTDIPIRRKNGEIRIALWNWADIRSKDGTAVIATIAQGQDITERKKAEEALRESEERFRILFDQANDGIFLLSPDGDLVSVNDAFARMHGYSKDELLHMNVKDLDTAESSRRAPERMRGLLAGEARTFEVEHFHKDGHVFPLEVSASQISFGGKILIQCFHRDITERRRAEDAIQRRDAVLDAVRFAAERFLRIPDWRAAVGEVLARLGEAARVSRVVVFEIEPAADGEVLLSWRHEWAAAGLEPRAGEQHLQHMPLRALGFARWIHELGEGRAIHGLVRDLPASEQSALAAQGIRSVAAVPIFAGGQWWGFIGFDHCLSESSWGAEQIDALRLAAGILGEAIQHERAETARLQLEAQLQQAQKMESVGRLAGGVAHDFNNMLSVILGHAELALTQVEASHPLKSGLLAIQKAANHSANLTSQLLAFASRQTVVPKVLNLNDRVAAMLKMLQRLIGEDIALVWTPDARLWPVKIDPTQIDQLLANLCVNARDAISGVGRLTIETRNTTVDAAACRHAPEVTPGDYVVLAMSDNGSGMSKEVIDRIFEPFFTTKALGRGTGLGLATVYGIVRQNDGFITVSSEPGIGTTFRIHLPRYDGEFVEPLSPATVDPPHARGETVLLVEDEPAILEVTAALLERLGYTVLAAGSPEEALRLAREHAGDIHLLLTDVVMPEMNGQNLATEVLSFRPKVRSLFMSGYTADVIAQRGILEDDVHFIQKPFTKLDLATKLRQVLDSEWM